MVEVVAGLLVGFIVGMTGVGGGALMTPVLVLVFGYSPATAVGTDLIFATVTKLAGVAVHRSRGTVDWQVTARLACGSIPAAALVVGCLAWLGPATAGGVGWLTTAIGLTVILTALGLGLRNRCLAEPRGWHLPLTVAAGAVLGTLVALTSIGAGALGAVMLVWLYPRKMTAPVLAGTDLAHAIPVALVAGIGHLALGNVDTSALGGLLAGSIPGVVAGSHLSSAAPEKAVRALLIAVLTVVGVKMLLA